MTFSLKGARIKRRWTEEKCHEELLLRTPPPPDMTLAQMLPADYRRDLVAWCRQVRRLNLEIVSYGHQPVGLTQFQAAYPTYPFVEADFALESPEAAAVQLATPSQPNQDSQEACEAYVALCYQDVTVTHRLRLWALRLARRDADAQLEQLTEQRRRLAEQIRTVQTERADLVAEANRTADRMAEAAAPLVEPREEFERIMALPGVVSVSRTNGGVKFVVEARHRQADQLYDLGDWSIILTPRTSEFIAMCVRSGLRRQWRNGDHPAYRLMDPRQFCFGPRQSELDQHLARRQYLEAMALAVECLCSINREDSYLVPMAFKRV
jgi:hypothetical protein